MKPYAAHRWVGSALSADPAAPHAPPVSYLERASMAAASWPVWHTIAGREGYRTFTCR